MENVLLTTTPGAFISSQPPTPDVVSEIDREEFSFLPHIIQILEKVETGKNEQEIKNMKARKLKEKFRRCQQILHELPGADLSREEQEQILRKEKQLLDQKR
ncbi:1859_t:CDS:2 [Acaulospora colombiana]|uniref:1859_t:CDS:1 n=1 Tax=Acaulospora colombiana TaxID=27376 RepID=A0ACA9KJG3_9GLOM|nr:1859_t:CDS:2 [Acaulospora colombiana]